MPNFTETQELTEKEKMRAKITSLKSSFPESKKLAFALKEGYSAGYVNNIIGGFGQPSERFLSKLLKAMEATK